MDRAQIAATLAAVQQILLLEENAGPLLAQEGWSRVQDALASVQDAVDRATDRAPYRGTSLLIRPAPATSAGRSARELMGQLATLSAQLRAA